eukprot:scaffold4779_cov116-Isochrysis_galbana.AAC.10
MHRLDAVPKGTRDLGTRQGLGERQQGARRQVKDVVEDAVGLVGAPGDVARESDIAGGAIGDSLPSEVTLDAIRHNQQHSNAQAMLRLGGAQDPAEPGQRRHVGHVLIVANHRAGAEQPRQRRVEVATTRPLKIRRDDFPAKMGKGLEERALPAAGRERRNSHHSPVKQRPPAMRVGRASLPIAAAERAVSSRVSEGVCQRRSRERGDGGGPLLDGEVEEDLAVQLGVRPHRRAPIEHLLPPNILGILGWAKDED